MLLGDVKIKRKEVKSYLASPFFLEALKLWVRWKRFGLPYQGGWAKQPYEVLRAIEIIEEEYQQELKNDDNRRA